MKDALIALAEALRLARLELDCHKDPECRASPEWTIKRLDFLLNDPAITTALGSLFPEIESPPLTPAQAQSIPKAPSHPDTGNPPLLRETNGAKEPR